MFNTIKQRILLGYALVIVVAVLSAVILTKNNDRVEGLVDTYVSQTLPSLNAINSIHSDSKELVLIAYSLYGTTLGAEQFDKRKKQIAQSISQQFALLANSGSVAQREFNKLLAAITVSVVQGNASFEL